MFEDALGARSIEFEEAMKKYPEGTVGYVKAVNEWNYLVSWFYLTGLSRLSPEELHNKYNIPRHLVTRTPAGYSTLIPIQLPDLPDSHVLYTKDDIIHNNDPSSSVDMPHFLEDLGKSV